MRYNSKVKLKTILAMMFLSGLIDSSALASSYHSQNYLAQNYLRSRPKIAHRLTDQPGFLRFSFDNAKQQLIGLQYNFELTPCMYAGIGSYSAISGGGLFTLGIDAGYRVEIFPRWFADASFYIGGGGGNSRTVGGGLLLKPQVGVIYAFDTFRLGLHYGMVRFPSGNINSRQFGLDFEVPTDFCYIPACYHCIQFRNGFLATDRNDVGTSVMVYKSIKNSGVFNQNRVITLLGLELDHYLNDNLFGYIKASGALHGAPSGYFDVISGFGYKFPIDYNLFSFVPQIGAGAGGGSGISTRGALVNPQLGLDMVFMPELSGRLSVGYIWAPRGDFNNSTLAFTLFYHMDVANGCRNLNNNVFQTYCLQHWQFSLMNQTYVRAQHSGGNGLVNLINFQFDQFFTPYNFMAYQLATAYSGQNVGGYTSGMFGPGIQFYFDNVSRFKFFAELLVGSAGGGNLNVGGGGIIEPVLGLHYTMNDPSFAVVASISQVKAFNGSLNTPSIQFGITYKFGTVNAVDRNNCKTYSDYSYR